MFLQGHKNGWLYDKVYNVVIYLYFAENNRSQKGEEYFSF